MGKNFHSVTSIRRRRLLVVMFVGLLSVIVPLVSASQVHAAEDSIRTWQELATFSTNDGGKLVGFASPGDRETYLSCLDDVQAEAVASGLQNWDFKSCDIPEIAFCKEKSCSGTVIDSPGIVTYAVFEISNEANAQVIVSGCGGPDNVACIEASGCAIAGDESMRYITCPFQATQVGTLDVDMDKWRQGGSGKNTNQASASVPVSGVVTPESRAFPSDSHGTTASDPSVLSDVRTFGDPGAEAMRVGVAAGASIVLVILVLLPTQLINSTLEENGKRIRGWFRRRPRRTDVDQRLGNNSTRVSTSRRREWIWGFPVLIVAAVIMGFADPSFGLNAMSLRFVIVAFVTLLVVNYIGTFLVWVALRKRESSAIPVIRVHVLYLVVIAITAALSRFMGFNPALVFGAVITIEATRVATNIADAKAEAGSIGRLEFATIVVTILIGLAAWLGYSTVMPMLVGLQNAGGGVIGISIQETLAALTIEALTTLPILLLPLRFMPGAIVFRWNKIVWALSYGVALTLFVFILIPLPTSWGSVSMSTLTWVSALVAYGVVAILFWLAFRLRRTNKTL